MLNIKFTAGRPLSASALSELRDELVRLGVGAAAAPIGLSGGPTGQSASVAITEHFWIKLTGGGTGGVYAWQRVDAINGGTWQSALGSSSGTTSVDAAYETTGNASVTTGGSKVYLAWRDPISNNVLFTASTC